MTALTFAFTPGASRCHRSRRWIHDAQGITEAETATLKVLGAVDE